MSTEVKAFDKIKRTDCTVLGITKDKEYIVTGVSAANSWVEFKDNEGDVRERPVREFEIVGRPQVRENDLSCCPADIRNAILQGHEILCKVWDSNGDNAVEAWVSSFDSASSYHFAGHTLRGGSNCWKNAVVVYKEVTPEFIQLKQPTEAFRALARSGWTLEEDGDFQNGADLFFASLFNNLGKEIPYEESHKYPKCIWA